jgi:acetyl-CoA carboxylase carboxyl transferase subunit alpha
VARNLKAELLKNLDDICGVPVDRLLEARYERLMSFGVVAT